MMKKARQNFLEKTEYAKRNKEHPRRSLRERIASESGMTLTEMLASLLILSMLTLVIAGGVMAVKHSYEKTVDKANAQMVLATTVELITDELSAAMQEEAQDGKIVFLSGTGNGWIWLGFDRNRGICRIPEDGGTADGAPLLSAGAMAEKYVTRFDEISYRDACFTLKNIAVYERAAAEDAEPVAVLPELKVRAVNLEGL